MLGFSPLASGPIATTGETNFPLAADAITTGQPVVPSITMFEDETFAADPILAGNPVLGSPVIAQVENLSADNITTGKCSE